MDTKKLVPYSVYLPQEHYLKLKEAAKDRKASVIIRDAIAMILDGGDAYKSGYNQAIREASKVVYDCPEAQMVAVKGRDIGDILSARINELEIK
jgi:bisphosphoglycerate-independent phosphoglycerate mutase (AlkP superfamily)